MLKIIVTRYKHKIKISGVRDIVENLKLKLIPKLAKAKKRTSNSGIKITIEIKMISKVLTIKRSGRFLNWLNRSPICAGNFRA